MAPVPLILDVDTGIDDALALLYAIASPEVELRAVTTVDGNVSASQAARNSLAVLELAGVTNVEVASGPPADRALASPGRHGPSGLGRAELPAPRGTISNRGAARLIVDEARARPGRLLLVATGPLTGIVNALALEPELPNLLLGLTIGGGAYRDEVAETNMRIDPGAARAAFAAFAGTARLPLCVGLDVTERARITRQDLDRLRAARGGDAIARFVDDAASFAIERSRRERGLDGAPLHDPLALAIAIDRSLAELEAVRVEVGENGTTSATASDPAEANALVARRVDTETFLARFLDRVGSLPTRPAPPR